MSADMRERAGELVADIEVRHPELSWATMDGKSRVGPGVALDVVDALLAAGLLATPESFEVMGRLTDGVRKALATRGGLLGQRIGLASDFPCNREHATPALVECGEHLVEAYWNGEVRAGIGLSSPLGRALSRLAAEREAARPKPRWTAVKMFSPSTSEWTVEYECEGKGFTLADNLTEPQARAIADALNALEPKP